MKKLQKNDKDKKSISLHTKFDRLKKMKFDKNFRKFLFCKLNFTTFFKDVKFQWKLPDNTRKKFKKKNVNNNFSTLQQRRNEIIYRSWKNNAYSSRKNIMNK